MTYMYIVSGGTLNHTHSLTVKYPVAFLAPFFSKIHNAHFLGTPVTAEHLVGKTVNGIDGSSSRPSIGRSVVGGGKETRIIAVYGRAWLEGRLSRVAADGDVICAATICSAPRQRPSLLRRPTVHSSLYRARR